MSGPTIRERIEALRPWPEGEPLIRALLVYEETVTRSASPTPNLDAMRQAERAARAAAPPVEPHALHFDPSCEECAYLARPVAIHVPAPDPVAGLREADQETWRQRIVEHLGPQRMSLYMSKDIDRMATGAVIAAALLAEPVPLDVERLARAIDDHGDNCSHMAIPECADLILARLTDPKGATDGE